MASGARGASPLPTCPSSHRPQCLGRSCPDPVKW
jgi:hypothetical protein